MASPGRRRACVGHAARHLGVSERRACAALGQHRSTQRKVPRAPDGEARLTADIVEPATRFGRYGHRRIAALLRDAGWAVNRKRVERIWRRGGLKAPPRRPKRGRLRPNDGSRTRPRPGRPDHVWACDFVEDRTRDGRRFRTPRAVAADVTGALAGRLVARGVPAHVRSDQGPESVAAAVKGWIAGAGARTAFIGKASPRENGCVEGLNGKPRDEPPRAEVFNPRREAQVLIERWRRHHNLARPHSALRHRPPAPEAITPMLPMPPPRTDPTGSAPPPAVLH